MAADSLATLSVENKTFYDRTLLNRLLPKLVWTEYGQSKPLPTREGDTINFRRFNSLAPATTPLTEGVTPNGGNMTITKVEATVKQYGYFITYTDKLDMLGIDPYVTETAEVLGEQAGETIDAAVRDVVVAGTSVQYVGGRANRDAITATDVLTGAEVKKAVKSLRNNNVKPLVGAYYVLIVDPEVADDLMNDADWKDVSKYNGGEAIMKGEVGRIWGAKVVVTTQVGVVTNTGGVDVHLCMLLGKDAYGVVDVKGSARKPEVIIKSLDSGGVENALNQRGSIGWKAMFTAVRLQELAMVRIECAVSE